MFLLKIEGDAYILLLTDNLIFTLKQRKYIYVYVYVCVVVCRFSIEMETCFDAMLIKSLPYTEYASLTKCEKHIYRKTDEKGGVQFSLSLW